MKEERLENSSMEPFMEGVANRALLDLQNILLKIKTDGNNSPRDTGLLRMKKEQVEETIENLTPNKTLDALTALKEAGEYLKEK